MTIKKKSDRIPPKTAADVLYKSNLQCCICKKEDVQIHHLNGKNNDHRIDNLACLCLPHHDKATITGSLTRKLSKETIIKYRDKHYQSIQKSREATSGKFDHPINKLTEESLLTASINALIIIDLEKIKEEYYNEDRYKRTEILEKIYKYSKHSNNRIALEVFEFLALISKQTRGGMSNNFGATIAAIIMEFLPSLHEKKDIKQSITLSKICVHIGKTIVYDSLIHLKKVSIAMHGLLIIKYIYRTAKENNIDELKNEVNEVYDFLESTLNRPERNDLGNAQELIKIYRADLEEWDLAFPNLTPNLQRQLSIDIQE